MGNRFKVQCLRFKVHTERGRSQRGRYAPFCGKAKGTGDRRQETVDRWLELGDLNVMSDNRFQTSEGLC